MNVKRQELEKKYQNRTIKLEADYKIKHQKLAEAQAKLKEREDKFDEIIEQKLAKKHIALMKDFDKTIKQRYDEIEKVLNSLRDRVDEEIKQDVDSEFEKIKERVKGEMTAYSQKFRKEKLKKIKEKKKGWF